MELIDSSPLLADPARLHAVLERDGYVFLRGAVPAEEVGRVSAAVTGCLRERGWLSGPVPDRHVEGTEHWATYAAVQSLEVFHQLAHGEHLSAVRRALLGGSSFVLPLKVLRMIRPCRQPKEKFAHRDYDAFRIPGMLTAWVALVDIPQELGALRVAPGSHQQGDHMPMRWATADYRAGDVVVLAAHTVHTGQPNRTADKIRLSADFRWQSTSTPVPGWVCEPHQAGQLPGWAELTRGWASREWIAVPPGVARTGGDGGVFHG